MVYVDNMFDRSLGTRVMSSLKLTKSGIMRRTGIGRCKREAASLSPGASKATTGAPKVTPIKAANDPPKE